MSPQLLHGTILFFTRLHHPLLAFIFSAASLTFLGGMTSIIVQLNKPLVKKLEDKYGMQAEKLTVALLGLISFTISLASDLVSVHPESLGQLGSNTAIIMSAAVTVYHFGLSAQYKKLLELLQNFRDYLGSRKVSGDSAGTPSA